mmetsp:Transcript_5379/g.8314  ORF Transcript_5379/g.8314 Transcript_5379/m.8314 type:complete len:84 (+) Transcript_5379:627-878(+)
MMELSKGHDSLPFDQYADKKSTYNPDLYTSTLDKSKITKAQEAVASKVERELQGKQTSPRQETVDEEMMSAVENIRPRVALQP